MIFRTAAAGFDACMASTKCAEIKPLVSLDLIGIMSNACSVNNTLDCKLSFMRAFTKTEPNGFPLQAANRTRHSSSDGGY